MSGEATSAVVVSSTASNSSSSAANAADMTTAELRTHVERCKRLTGRPQLLDRLPDSGENIRWRLEAFTQELARRAQSAPPAEAEKKGIAPNEGTAQPEAIQSVDSTSAPQAEEMKTYASNVAAIMEKYKDHRVPVEETVRKMYGSSLSEQEIARILEDVPTQYFLTYSETQAREREMAKQARREELAKLTQQSAIRRP